MKLKTIRSIRDGKVSVTLEDYDKKECGNILTERNSYVLEARHCWGEDYGGSQRSDEDAISYEEIIPERILVKDGHFYGVSICVEYDYYNGGHLMVFDDAVLLLDKTIEIDTPKARSGFSFSNNDHDRWNYTDYSLIDHPTEDFPIP